jgi:hypothetical protein
MPIQDDILDALEDEREKLVEALEGLSESDLTAPNVVGEWSIRQVLIHLSFWEAELVKLLWQARQGDRPTTAQLGLKSVDQYNAEWQEIAKDRSLEQVLSDFAAVRRQTARRVEPFNDAELSDPRAFPWLGGRPLAEWIAESSYAHDAEHAAEILAWRARH